MIRNQRLIDYHRRRPDATGKLYVWISQHFAQQFGDESQLDKVAQRYLAQDRSGRKPQQIVKVHQGSEDSGFKAFFKNWN